VRESAKLINALINPLYFWEVLEGVFLDRGNFVAVKAQVLDGLEIMSE
jgi:hypothetical protein